MLHFFNTYFPALGWLLLYFLLTCSFINLCCQHKFGQNGFCCNAFCSDSTCTHPLCSSSLHVGLFWEGLQLLCLAAFFLEQVHYLIQFSFCCLFSTRTFLPYTGSCCMSYWPVHLSTSVVNTNLDTEWIWSYAFCSDLFVLIHFVAVLFMWVCFGRVCSCFVLLHFSKSKYIIWYSFHFAAFFQHVLSCRGLALAVCLTDLFIYQPLLSTQIWTQNGFCWNAFCSDSTCTHPLCSSSLHVGLFWEGSLAFLSCCMFLRAST